jgi:hypothetical protein
VRRALGAALVLLVAVVAACNMPAKDVAKDALTASQILCVLASNLTDSKAVAAACQIDQALVPLIEPFLAQKEALAAGQSRRSTSARCGADAGAGSP